MAIHVVRLGSARERSEGPRLGTVRYPPRGVRKEDLAKRDFYDVWVPALAPSAELIRWFKETPESDGRWKTFARRYRSEMSEPERRQLLDLLAVLSRGATFSVGCYCADEERCHRSLLREVLAERGAELA